MSEMSAAAHTGGTHGITASKLMREPLSLLLLLLALLLPTLAACSDKAVKTTGVSITGLDHLAEHLSIQDFWVDGTAGQQAGKGGRQVCCASIPSKWQPGTKVNVQWGVTNWKRRVYTMYEKDVAVTHCPDAYPGRLWVHFLADGDVQAVSCGVGPGFYEKNVEYPGPQPLSILPKKQPWTDYKRKPGEPEFTEVKNAMEDEKK